MAPKPRLSFNRVWAVATVLCLCVAALAGIGSQADASAAGAAPAITPTVTPTATSVPTGTCEVRVSPDPPVAAIGETVNFNIATDVGTTCDFLLYELTEVDAGGLFAPVTVPVGPPGPRQVQMTATAAGTGIVSLTYYGETKVPDGNGGHIFNWAYRTATTTVTVTGDSAPPTPTITPTPTVGAGDISCELLLDPDPAVVPAVGDSITLDLTIDCTCTIDGPCFFANYQLWDVDTGGLFEPVAVPVGPPGPTSVTLTAASVGSGIASLTWYGEVQVPTGGGGFFWTRTYLTAEVDVAVGELLVGDADCSGSVTLLDARAVALYAIDVIATMTCDDGTAIEPMTFDFNADGRVSLLDARVLALCTITDACDL